MAERVFACGALAKGMVHFRRVGDYVKNIQPATVLGQMYKLEVGYPVFYHIGNDLIHGEILDIEASDLFFRVLDEFYGFSARTPEKSLFLKVPVEANMGGETVTVTTYSINPAKLPKTATIIDGGDWRSVLSAQPPMVEGLSDRQKTYVRRLGSSSGRDIVPINLELYRELMNLGLIVDKGRRLALTRLGQEVYRFLD